MKNLKQITLLGMIVAGSSFCSLAATFEVDDAGAIRGYVSSGKLEEENIQADRSNNRMNLGFIFDVDDVLVLRGYPGKWKEYWQLFKEVPQKASIIGWFLVNGRLFIKNIKQKTVSDLIDWMAENNKSLLEKSSDGKTHALKLKELISKGRPIQEMVDILISLKKQGYQIAIATNQDSFTFDYLVSTNVLPSQETYSLVYTKDYNANLILRKPSHSFFYDLNSAVDKRWPQECVRIFIDDKKENVEAAEQCGISGIHYQNALLFVNALRSYGVPL